MTTIITGAGLIGTAYAKEAAKRGEKTIFIDPLHRGDYLAMRLGDIDYEIINDDSRSLSALIDAIKKHKPDTFLHTAGLIGKRVADPIRAGYDLNIGSMMAVVEAVRITGIKRLVQLSTFGVYDWRISDGHSVISESFPRGSGSAYSNSKAAQELIVEAYRIQCGFEAVVLRPGNVFGMGHFWGGSGGGKKIYSLIEAGVKGTRAVIPEEQTMAFEYIYADDMGRAVDLAATVEGLPADATYNLSWGRAITFDELVSAVKTSLPDLDIEIISGTRPESRMTPLDISRARDELGWKPSFTLEEALAAYANEIRAQNE
ncbi:MAG: UDP-glucose 4-epimerase [Alphaproteobacteria bacterium MarineAlpha11_Bin1]|nr:MAG: UDP-glucose 4-epimerase [Alphaproteobacteria bacterium MarineAlpha11_Bin1]|tara:strand:+ start:1984 stop:2931 length:948 start_codon:yes stop_codon:yes gene_type:complete